MNIDEEEHRCILAQDITGELSLKILTTPQSLNHVYVTPIFGALLTCEFLFKNSIP